ncbi:PhoH family protein [Parvularcula marina]|nr:PhoH family protein [Parvularcula marina]
MTDTETLTFDRNELMSDLCGPHDTNLLLIENLLGVKVLPRGNQITLSGSDGARLQAKAALQSLYGRLEKGLPIAGADVEAALRLIGEDSGTKETSAGPALTFPRRTVVGRTRAQIEYLTSMSKNELVFGVGPAGTGKTYLAVAHAALQLKQEKIERIILSRPAVEAGERIGFLPGDMKEKVDPYLRPLYDALYDVLGHEYVDRRIDKEIEIAPLAFMRGRTLSRAMVVLDEAQNATIAQMKMFLTRLGEGSAMIVTGDPSQTDLPDASQSGLQDALSLLNGIDGVSITRFTGDDVVRHRLVKEIVNAYDARDQARMAKSRKPSREGKS